MQATEEEDLFLRVCVDFLCIMVSLVWIQETDWKNQMKIPNV